jgi:REP element-mobilizing transposase RayT
MFDPTQHHRQSVRHRDFDYRTPGAYFVTVCAARRKQVFGTIENGEMRLHIYGRLIVEEWQRTAKLRHEIELDEFVVMPNHFHAIVYITPALNATPNAATPTQNPTKIQRRPRSLSSLMAQFKASATRAINTHRAAHGLSPVSVWQRSFHDRIIRDEKELNAIRRYIIENPLHWEHDTENPTPHKQP